MTRIAILADIHGNLPALNAVIDDMSGFKVDHVVVAGDSVNWGPFSRAVLEINHCPQMGGHSRQQCLLCPGLRDEPRASTLVVVHSADDSARRARRNLAKDCRQPAGYAFAALSRCAARARFPRHTGQSLDIHASAFRCKRDRWLAERRS